MPFAHKIIGSDHFYIQIQNLTPTFSNLELFQLSIIVWLINKLFKTKRLFATILVWLLCILEFKNFVFFHICFLKGKGYLSGPCRQIKTYWNWVRMDIKCTVKKVFFLRNWYLVIWFVQGCWLHSYFNFCLQSTIFWVPLLSPNKTFLYANKGE